MAILAAVAGAPVAVLVAMLWPGRWAAALVWPLVVLALVLGDALVAALARGVQVRVSAPDEAHVGQEAVFAVALSFPGRAPARVQVVLDAGPLLAAVDGGLRWVRLVDGMGAATIRCHALRRGVAHADRLWLRWPGPLGLVWFQQRPAIGVSLSIVPDTLRVAERGAQLLRRDTLPGQIDQRLRGAGAEFDALTDFHSGMDRRAIDWKHSARHNRLLAREYDADRNTQIVFAVDCGRQMCEPVAGLSRLDRVVAAALVNAWVALRLGDMAGLYAFDSRPRLASGLVSGNHAFAALRTLAAQIDYGAHETNHTLGLATLTARLARRAMIVLFTEFADAVSAELMLRGAARLAETHVLLVVVLRDDELEAMRDRRPAEADDVTRAVTAAELLRDRQVVLARLRQLGVRVIEAEYDRVGERIVAAYLDLKRRNLL